jgi:hypothetical protein
MNNTKVHIITGNPNTGKTTTAWLIYLLLKEKGKVEYFRVFHDGKYEILPESQTPLNEIETYPDYYGTIMALDFCALIVVNNIRVAIFSPGDNAETIEIGFNWEQQVNPDVFIGCCRNSFNSYARCKLHEYEKEYDMSLHRVYKDYDEADFENAKESRKALAQKIVDNIIEDIN